MMVDSIYIIEVNGVLTPLAVDWGYAGRKIRFRQAMEFSEAGWLATNPSA